MDIKNSLLLVINSYRLLHLGHYLISTKSKKSPDTLEIVKSRDGIYALNVQLVEKLIDTDLHNFSHLLLFQNLRGVIVPFFEMIALKSPFSDYVQKTMGKQFRHYYEMMRLLRNIMVHQISFPIIVKQKDINLQKKQLLYEGISSLNVDINYSTLFSQWKGTKDYGFIVNLDLTGLHAKIDLDNLISVFDMCMLAELANNFAISYLQHASNHGKSSRK